MEITFPLILDGATGTELQKRGFTGSMSAEEWTLENPDAITEIQRGYVEAGSNIVYSPTFGANSVKLESHGIFNRTAEMNTALVGISKEAVGGKGWVAGDISPTGQFLYPLGDMSFEDMVTVYTEQAEALEKAGVDLFVIETMMTLPEARAAVLAVKSVSKKPIFVTFTCDENGKTLTNTDVCAALNVMQGMGVSAFGLNCSTGPDKMLEQLRRLSDYARVPLIAKPNAGFPEIVDGKTVYNCPPEEFVLWVEAMAECGVGIFGGCCGTEKAHIEALREALSKVSFKAPAPKYADMLPCSTEKAIAYLPVDAEHGDVLSCNDELEDNIYEALENDEVMLAIEINTREEAEIFGDIQYIISKPLCIVSDNEEALEEALRRYQGRALYEGSLSNTVLEKLSEKYGLIF